MKNSQLMLLKTSSCSCITGLALFLPFCSEDCWFPLSVGQTVKKIKLKETANKTVSNKLTMDFFEVKCLLITSFKNHTLLLPLFVSIMDNCSSVTVFWTRCGGRNVSEFQSQSLSLHAVTLLQAGEKTPHRS